MDHSLLIGLANSVGQESTEYIGGHYHNDMIDPLTHIGAHGIIGCRTGYVLSKDCGAGALGAVVSETSA